MVTWTAELDSRLVSLWSSGMEIPDIARALALAGPDAVTDRVSTLTERRKWPPGADAQRKGARLEKHRCDCGRGFATARSLNGHKRVHGNAQTARAAHTAGPYTCPHCGLQVATRQGLGGHIAGHHGRGATLLPCPVCGGKARDQEALDTHLEVRHGRSTVPMAAPSGRGYTPENPASQADSPVAPTLEATIPVPIIGEAGLKHLSVMPPVATTADRLEPAAPEPGRFACVDCGGRFATAEELRGHRDAHKAPTGDPVAFAAFRIDGIPGASAVSIEFTASGRDAFAGAWQALRSLGAEDEYDVRIEAVRREVRADA